MVCSAIIYFSYWNPYHFIYLKPKKDNPFWRSLLVLAIEGSTPPLGPYRQGLYCSLQSLEFLKKSWNLTSNFPDLEKVWTVEIKSWKSLISEFFFCFGHILFNLARMFAAHHEKSFVPAFFKVSIDQLFDNLESGKRNYCFGKMSWKSLEFWIKKSVRTLFREHCHWSGNWSPN